MSGIDIAVITAAGWKGAGRARNGLDLCPESLLPIAHGVTPLSRQAGQLENLGFQVFIGVGRPGCSFPHWHQGQRASPWTPERVEYAACLGTVVVIPDPDIGTSNSTACQVLQQIVIEWDRVFVTAGDFLFSDALLCSIVDLSVPFWFLSHDKEQVFFLDRQASDGYCRWAAHDGWIGSKRKSHMVGMEHLVECGVKTCTMPECFPGRDTEWTDIDIPSDYIRAVRWMQRYA